MENKGNTGWLPKYFGALILFVLTVRLGYTVEQWQFNAIIRMYAILFLTYLAIFHHVKREKDIWFFIAIAILLRCSLLFAVPALSDDVYRFIWDGRLLLNGINPFDQTPSYYIENNIQIPGITPELYQELNSPDYFTIYPPVAQAVFALAVWLFPQSILGSTIVMKLFLLAGEIGSLYLITELLKHFQLPLKNVLLYALNPLIIIEIMGNLHFEGPMIFFLLLSLYLPLKGKYTRAGIAMGFSIASKLLPVIFLPFFIRRLGWRRSLLYFTATGVTVLLLFFPLINEVFIQNFGSSLDLYFRRFEFNASIYYLLRWYGFQQVGYNLIHLFGPLLAACTFLSIVVIAFFEKSPGFQNLPLKMLIAISIYLALTTTIHPWYASLPLLLCIFTKFRFPILWSGLIFLSYINYSYEQYYENLYIVTIEYLAVLSYLSYEIKINKNESYS